MEAKEVLHIMQQIAASATLEDAEAFLATCRERGLTPFSEVSPIITDYTRKDGTRVHSMSVKEHYSVMERWARQCGGYSIRQRRVWRDEAGVHAEIGLVSNRDYAAVGQLCARVPGLDFQAELAGFMAVEEAIVTADEMGKKQPPKGKSWEWLAEKRAREAALLRLFGREPSQARQLYHAAIGALTAQQANALLYDAPAPALPAPAPAPTHTDVGVAETEDEGETEGEPGPAPAPAPTAPTTPQAHWIDDAKTSAAFWARAHERGLTQADVLAALGVERVRDFPGTLAEAGEAIKRHIEKKTGGGAWAG